MTPATAYDAIDPAHAADLARVLDLRARWENLRDDPAAPGPAPAGRLMALQTAFEAYRSQAARYAGRYPSGRVPETSRGGVAGLAAWCRAAAAVARRAGGADGLADAVTRAYRLADRIAKRIQTAPPVSGGGAADPARELDAVARWCDGVGPAGPNAGTA